MNHIECSLVADAVIINKCFSSSSVIYETDNYVFNNFHKSYFFIVHSY